MTRERITNRAKRRLMVRFGVDQLDRTAFTRNVSPTGLALQTNHLHPPGTMLQVELKLPDRTFTLWARVVWAKRVPAALASQMACGMGLQFVDPGPEWNEHFKAWSGRGEGS